MSWEFRWQQAQWARLYADPESKKRVHEYWRKHRSLDDIREIVALGADTKILDVGCGLSTVLEFLSGKRYGIDPLADRYKTIYEYSPEIDIRQGAGEAIPFADKSFDVVFCSNSIDHHDDPARSLSEIDRVLRPGGFFILTCETFGEDLGVRNAGHPHSMTRQRLLDLVARFVVVKHWDAPWYGLRRYVLGLPPEQTREQIVLLEKRS